MDDLTQELLFLVISAPFIGFIPASCDLNFVKMHCCFLDSFILFDLGSLLENLFHMPPLTRFYLSKQFLSTMRPWIFLDL